MLFYRLAEIKNWNRKSSHCIDIYAICSFQIEIESRLAVLLYTTSVVSKLKL